MNTYKKDKTNQDILLSHDNQQVMMEWEKPYMEQSIDKLKPTGDVLEIGFGLGYSATQIMKYKPKSYTVIECDPNVIEYAKKWSTQYPDTPIYIIEGRWQEKLSSVGLFDSVYFDDFPLDIHKNSTKIDVLLSRKRLNIFIDICIQNHTKIGSRLSWYSSGNNGTVILSSDTMPFIRCETEKINISIPEHCTYRNNKDQNCTIIVIEKNREYDFMFAQQYALQQMKKYM